MEPGQGISRLLFTDFRSNPRVYESAERFWSGLLEPLVLEHQWDAPWLGTHAANGRPLQDGSMYSAISKVLRRAFYVEQFAADEDTFSLVARMANVGEDGKVTVLHLLCVPSIEAASDVLDIVDSWTDPRGRDSIEPVLRRLGFSQNEHWVKPRRESH